MSFDLEDIADELLSATGKGREWFDGEGYSFQRLGKVRNDDIQRLANALRMKRWRRKNYALARQRELACAARLRADAARWAARLAYARRRNKRPDLRAALLAKAKTRARARYQRMKADGRWEAQRTTKREYLRRYHQAVKTDRARMAKRKEQMRAAKARYRAAQRSLRRPMDRAAQRAP